MALWSSCKVCLCAFPYLLRLPSFTLLPGHTFSLLLVPLNFYHHYTAIIIIVIAIVIVTGEVFIIWASWKQFALNAVYGAARGAALLKSRTNVYCRDKHFIHRLKHSVQSVWLRWKKLSLPSTKASVSNDNTKSVQQLGSTRPILIYHELYCLNFLIIIIIVVVGPVRVNVCVQPIGISVWKLNFHLSEGIRLYTYTESTSPCTINWNLDG